MGGIDELLGLARCRKDAGNAIAVGRINGDPAPVETLHAVAAVSAGALPIYRAGIVAGHGVVTDEHVAVEPHRRDHLVQLPTSLLAGNAGPNQPCPFQAAQAVLVGDDGLGDLAGAHEHGPPVPAVDQGADEPDRDAWRITGPGPVAGEHTDAAQPQPVGVQVAQVGGRLASRLVVLVVCLIVVQCVPP